MKKRILIAAFVIAVLCASLTSAAFMKPQPKPANTIEVIEQRLARYEQLNKNYVPPSQDEIIEERLKRLEGSERNRESSDSSSGLYKPRNRESSDSIGEIFDRQSSSPESYGIVTDEQKMRRLKVELRADRLRVKYALSTGMNTSRDTYIWIEEASTWSIFLASPRIPITPSERDQLNKLLPRLDKALREPKTKQTPGICPIGIIGILVGVVILLRGKGEDRHR